VGEVDTKIAMVAPFSIYPKGTVTMRMLPIAKNLAKSGNVLSIIVPPYDNPSESGREYLYEGIKIINVKFFDLPILKYPLTVLQIWLKIVALNAECVYIFKPKGYSGLAAMFMVLLKRFGLIQKKILIDTDDLEGLSGFADYYRKSSTYPELMLSFFDLQERWIPKHVEGITVASRALEKKLLNEGIPKRMIFYVPNGEPQRSFIPKVADVLALRKKLGLETVPVVLLYTRFFEYHLEQVVEIFKNVKKGEFGEEKKLMQLTLMGGLGNSVIFGGWVAYENIPAYLALGDVALYPFDDTPLNRAKCPGKLIELMKSGRAIVANKVGQIAEYIEDHKSGILVNSADPSDFSSRVIELLRNDDLRIMLGANAQKRLSNSFNWDLLSSNVQRAVTLNYKK
jgi:glycosyltransferase involved in cell wall biosynthesis